MQRVLEKLEGYKHVVWDWNGTLLDDTELCVRIIGEILREHGLSPIDIQTYKERFRFPVKTYYQSLGFDFTQIPFETVADLFIERYDKVAGNCSLFSGARALIEDLHRRQIGQTILSAAKHSSLVSLTEKHSLQDFVQAVYGLDDHYATSKVELGLRMVEDLKIDPAECILVGDTEHDHEVAKALGMEALLIADGHQSVERLTKTGANVISTRY